MNLSKRLGRRTLYASCLSHCSALTLVYQVPHSYTLRSSDTYAYFINKDGTETNRRIYALDVASGALVWRSERLGASKSLNCIWSGELNWQVWAPHTVLTWNRGILEAFVVRVLRRREIER